jgi:hypothetical protein
MAAFLGDLNPPRMAKLAAKLRRSNRDSGTNRVAPARVVDYLFFG